MLKRPLISLNSVIFHNLAIFACNNSTWIFEKVAPEDLAIFTGTTPKLGIFDSHEPRNHTGEKREGRRERGEEKRAPCTHNFNIAYFGDSF